MTSFFGSFDIYGIMYSTFLDVLLKVSVVTSIIVTLIYIVLVQLFFERLFRKHHYPSSYNKIPFVNLALLLRILSLPGMYSVLFLVPIINIIFILYVDYRLCLLYKKPSRVFFQMIFLPFIAFDRFIPDPKKSAENIRRAELEKQRQEEIKRAEREKSMKEETPNLLSEDEFKELNKQLVEEQNIDSLFKKEDDNREDVVTYKAIDTSKLIEAQKANEAFEMNEFVYKPVNQKATALDTNNTYVSDSKELEEINLDGEKDVLHNDPTKHD